MGSRLTRSLGACSQDRRPQNRPRLQHEAKLAARTATPQLIFSNSGSIPATRRTQALPGAGTLPQGSHRMSATIRLVDKLTRMTPEAALARLTSPADQPSLTVYEHGTLQVEFYKPVGVDKQTAHNRDEIYVVWSGTGTFQNDGISQPFEPGEVLFVPAGIEHRFVDFSADFATWVFFYGPVGGERKIDPLN